MKPVEDKLLPGPPPTDLVEVEKVVEPVLSRGDKTELSGEGGDALMSVVDDDLQLVDELLINIAVDARGVDWTVAGPVEEEAGFVPVENDEVLAPGGDDGALLLDESVAMPLIPEAGDVVTVLPVELGVVV